MPAKDFFHEVVKSALIKDGWIITHDPLFLKFGRREMYVDLGAEKLLGAEKGERKIAVEIKSFIGDSLLTEFHKALGQFINYRIVLEEKQPERVLYLAVPLEIYEDFFSEPLTQLSVERNQVKLMVYEDEKEVIVKWKS